VPTPPRSYHDAGQHIRLANSSLTVSGGPLPGSSPAVSLPVEWGPSADPLTGLAAGRDGAVMRAPEINGMILGGVMRPGIGTATSDLDPTVHRGLLEDA
jgi:hypothetical protein